MSAIPSVAAPDVGGEHVRGHNAPWVALAWSAVALGLGLGWWSGVVPASAANETGFGSLFASADSPAAAVMTLVMGLVGVVCAVLMLGSARTRVVEWGAWALAACALVAFVDGQLLAWLGYSMILPVAVWFVPGLGASWVQQTFTATHLTTLFFVTGVAVWAVAALGHRRAVDRACQRCGRGPLWSVGVEHAVRVRALGVGRVAVAVACVVALVYPALRLPWIFGVTVGVSQEEFAAITAEPGTVFIGVGLGSAAVVGVVLMVGLVQRWGARFPRWMVGLGGRRVPVGLAVVPATLVAVALVAMGRSAVVELVRGQEQGLLTAEPLHTTAFVSMAVWGVALGVATVAYAVRRRGECAGCGRGLPEAAPGEIRSMV